MSAKSSTVKEQNERANTSDNLQRTQKPKANTKSPYARYARSPSNTKLSPEEQERFDRAVAELVEKVPALAKRSQEGIYELGRLLDELKRSGINDGQWVGFIKNELPFSVSSAYNYHKVYLAYRERPMPVDAKGNPIIGGDLYVLAREVLKETEPDRRKPGSGGNRVPPWETVKRHAEALRSAAEKAVDDVPGWGAEDGLFCREDWDAETVITNYRYQNWTVRAANLEIAGTLGSLGADLLLNYFVRAGVDEVFGSRPDRRWDTEYELPKGLARSLRTCCPRRWQIGPTRR